MRIEPFVGVGGAVLGMEREAVVAAMGEPDDRDVFCHSDGSVNQNWEYPGGLELTFSSEDDWRLSSITVTAPEAELGGRRLVGLTEEAFLRAAGEMGMELVLEDANEELDYRNYECDALELTFWVHEGVVGSITVFARYDEERDVWLWPEG